MPKIKSPLRYPGGKSRALKQILPLVPDFDEFREPMVGGGSVFFALKQLNQQKIFWINDVNIQLFSFWKYCQMEVYNLTNNIINFKSKFRSGKELHSFLLTKEMSELDSATRFFILNRITFSGLAESGGYSEGAFKARFTDSSIKRLELANSILADTKITCEDYEKVVNSEGKKVFIFLDPPYYSTMKSRLYGKEGVLHFTFDHKRFAKVMRTCNHKWLITYDDSPEIRRLFSFANIYEWELQYGMNNYKQKTAAKGKELFISNYNISSLKPTKSLIAGEET
ncbi:MAG: DNA adenine methylase [Nanoarchaeota archaeon]|nr:DNA adenine methylase [Nanoarchaeota archaeon]